jgi:hypothetical protein
MNISKRLLSNSAAQRVAAHSRIALLAGALALPLVACSSGAVDWQNVRWLSHATSAAPALGL